MPGWVRFTLTIPGQNYIDAHKEVANLDAHPLKAEVRAYLSWKRRNS